MREGAAWSIAVLALPVAVVLVKAQMRGGASWSNVACIKTTTDSTSLDRLSASEAASSVVSQAYKQIESILCLLDKLRDALHLLALLPVSLACIAAGAGFGLLFLGAGEFNRASW
jgi:hypothetical protein